MTLYESEASCGGHTLTDTSSGYPVDLGFQVYNLTTYPHLVGLFERLGVETQPSEMSFALSMDGGRVEWGSHGLDSVFAQRSNLASPAFLGMIRDVLRFGRQAPEVLAPEHQAQVGRRRQGIIWYLDGTCRRQHCRRAATPAVPSCCRVFSRLGGEAARQCCERLLTLPSACLPACLPALPPPLPPPPWVQFGRMTLGQYLELRRYGTAFRQLYVAPMCAAVWSVPNAQVRQAGGRDRCGGDGGGGAHLVHKACPCSRSGCAFPPTLTERTQAPIITTLVHPSLFCRCSTSLWSPWSASGPTTTCSTCCSARCGAWSAGAASSMSTRSWQVRAGGETGGGAGSA